MTHPPHDARRSLILLAAAAAAASMAGCAAGSAKPAGSAMPVWVPATIPPPAPATEGFVDVGGARLWYWDTGGPGQPVVFLHAGSQSGAAWAYQQPAFAQAGFRAIGYSRRGHFRSEHGPVDDPGVASEDLLKLLDHLKVERAHLVAVALGAFYALDFALVHPTRLRTLSITSSYLGISETEREYFEANERLRPRQFEALPVEVRELHPSYRAGNPEGTAAWVKLAREASAPPRIRQKRPFDLTWARLESIRHPTLLMTGDGDLYTPPSLLRMQAAHMPHAEVHVIPEAGHAANWEQPAIYNARVLDFLRRHARPLTP